MNKGVKMNCLISLAIGLFSIFAAYGDGFDVEYRIALDQAFSETPGILRKAGVLRETPSAFDKLSQSSGYRNFAGIVSNRWEYVVTNLSELATNQWERLVTIGVGKTYDEDFYLSACTRLADLEQAGSITSKELLFMLSSSRTNIDMCVVSRYREPAVTNLVEKLRRVIPCDTYWDSVLSGEAYHDRISKNHNEF